MPHILQLPIKKRSYKLLFICFSLLKARFLTTTLLISSTFWTSRIIPFVDSYDPPLKGLHEDLNFVSPRIGEVVFSFSGYITLKFLTFYLKILSTMLINSFHGTLVP